MAQPTTNKVLLSTAEQAKTDKSKTVKVFILHCVVQKTLKTQWLILLSI